MRISSGVVVGALAKTDPLAESVKPRLFTRASPSPLELDPQLILSLFRVSLHPLGAKAGQSLGESSQVVQSSEEPQQLYWRVYGAFGLSWES